MLIDGLVMLGLVIAACILGLLMDYYEEEGQNMSLYTMGEICEGCRYAVLHSCGNCLKECKIKARDKASCIDGSCTEYTKEEEQNFYTGLFKEELLRRVEYF